MGISRKSKIGRAFLVLAALVVFGWAVSAMAGDRDQFKLNLKLKFERPQFKAKVKKVVEGDLLVLEEKGREFEVRLYGVDAPEKLGNQPYWEESRKAAEELCLGKTVEVGIVKKNLLKQWISVIILPDGKNLSWVMAENGHVWDFNEHFRHEVTIRRLVGVAMKKKVGLWAAKEKPIPPSIWFKKHVKMEQKKAKFKPKNVSPVSPKVSPKVDKASSKALNVTPNPQK